MSKEIDLTKPLSEDDLRYLVDRCRWDDIRTNAANLDLPEPNLPSARGLRKQIPRSLLKNTDSFDKIAEQLQVKIEESDGDEQDYSAQQQEEQDSGATDWSKLKVPELKAEMDRRRADYERDQDQEGVDLMTYGSDAKKDDLVAALTLDDSAEEDGEDGDK